MEKKPQTSEYKEALFASVINKLAIIRADIRKGRKAKTKQTVTK